MPYAAQAKSIKEAREKTCKEKYGGISPLCSKEIQEKIKNTNLKRYGFESPFQNPDVRNKIAMQKYINGTQSVSKQQLYFHSIFGGELNYPFYNYHIDIAFPDQKIAIEYNGGGHNLAVKLGTISNGIFIRNENFRRKKLYAENWKIITIISPSSKILPEIQAINLLKYVINILDSGRHWVEIHIDDQKIINSKQTILFTQITMND